MEGELFGQSYEEIPERDLHEEQMRTAMLRAWTQCANLYRRKREASQDEISEVRRRMSFRQEVSREWRMRRFADEDELRVGWKASDMERLTEISHFIWMKKATELEQAYAMKLRLKEAREKGLQPEKDIQKSYLRFRNTWTQIHSCWGGEFEDITKIHAMGYTDDPVPWYVYNLGPPDALQIFSVKVEEKIQGELSWPLQVFGLVAIRDSIDQHRNLIFNRKRDDCQTLTREDPYLVLTGPTRAVVVNDESIPVTIEAELNVKGTDGSEDKHLIFAAAPLLELGSISFDLVGKSAKLEIALGRVMTCVEASVFTRVIDGVWPSGFHGQIAAHTIIDHKKVVLAEFGGDVRVNGNVDQSRFVVSVETFGELVVSYKAWRGNEVMQGEVGFKPEKKGRSYGTLKVDSCILEVLVAWSVIRPVCEELVSMQAMAFD